LAACTICDERAMGTDTLHKQAPHMPPSWTRPDLWLQERSSAERGKPAVIFRNECVTYGMLWERVCRLAAGLNHEGVRQGERVACISSNHPAFLEAYFASSLLGAIFVPLNFRLVPPELSFQINDARPAVILFGPRQRELAMSLLAGFSPPSFKSFQVEEDVSGTSLAPYVSLLNHATAPPLEVSGRDFSPEEPQLIMYTSGTTGIPKGALLPFRKTLHNCLNAAIFFELSARDRVVVPTPLFHSLGLNILSVPVLFEGGSVILLEHFDAQTTLAAIEQHQGTFMGAVPTIYKRLLDYGLDRAKLDSVRFFFTAGAPIPVSVIEEYHHRGVLLKQGFGQTETSILCCLDAADAIRKAGSVGKPVVHAEVKIVDEQLHEVGSGVVGEIVARGPILMLGYWNRPEETERALAGSWLHTQDLAWRDEEGFITLAGRKGDMYISGGENIHPEEVETAYLSHPDIEEIAVIGVPDPDLGEVGLACVVLRSDRVFDEEALRGFAAGKLARYKIPRRFLRLDALPHTETGKIQKYLLREKLQQQPGNLLAQ